MARVLFLYNDIIKRPHIIPLMQLSAVAKSNGHKVALEGVSSILNVKEKIRGFKPDILAVSSTSGDYRLFHKCLGEVKKEFPDLYAIMGGAHPTYFPELIGEIPVDAFCIGEGEQAFLEILKAVEEKKDIANIKNLWIKTGNNRLEKNPLQPMIEDLDALPFPDRALYPEIEKEGYATILSSRGCPFQCTYCYNNIKRRIYGLKGTSELRTRSVDNVIKELVEIKRTFKSKLEYFHFADECFGFDTSWLQEFIGKYKKDVDMPFYVQMNPSLITMEKVKLMKEGGCWRINFAIETGDEKFREKLLKRYISNKKLIEVSRYIRSQGIVLSIQNMLLLPGETWSRAKETLELNIKCRPHISTATKFQPFPKLELTEKAIEMGLIDIQDTKDAFEIDMHWKSILKFKDQKMKNRISNLLNFFTFTARFPITKHAVYQFTRLPNNIIFREIDNVSWRKITWGGLENQKKSTLHECNLFTNIIFETIKNVIKSYMP